MFVVVEVEDGFLVGEPSRRLNLESLCDPAGSLDRFTRVYVPVRRSIYLYPSTTRDVSFASQETWR